MDISNTVESDASNLQHAVVDRHFVEEVLMSKLLTFFDVKEVDVNQDFFQLGGDSLKALILVSEIAHELQLKLPPTMLFDFPTIQLLSAELVRIGSESCTVVSAS